jgi:hypothetical protein
MPALMAPETKKNSDAEIELLEQAVEQNTQG